MASKKPPQSKANTVANTPATPVSGAKKNPSSQSSSLNSSSSSSANSSASSSANSSASSSHPPSSEITKIPSLWKHFLGYGIAIIIIGVLGYFYYVSFILNTNLKEGVALNQKSIEALEATLLGPLQETQKEVASLRQEKNKINSQLKELDDQVESFRASLQKLQPQEVWLLQINQLLYLAEQQRILGNRPSAISYLLLEARELVTASPSSENIALLGALNHDIQVYENFFSVETANIFQELGYLQEIINELPVNDKEFKFEYEDELEATQGVQASQGTQSTTLNSTNIANLNTLPIDNATITGITKYWNYVTRMFIPLTPYIRISRASVGPANLLSEQEIPLLRLAIEIKVLQAQSAILAGEEDLYKRILADIRENIINLFSENQQRNIAINLIDEMMEKSLLPKDLPALRSVTILYGP